MKSFCLLLCKHLLILKIVPKAALNFCSGFPFLSVMVDYLPGYIHGRLSEQFSESRAAFGTTFRVTGGFRTAEKPPEEDYWMDFKISK